MNTIQRAYRALWQRFREITHKNVNVDERGYVDEPADNLLPDVDAALVRADVQKGDGNEWREKFRAVHSSAALAANAFGRWKANPDKLRLMGQSGFTKLILEWKPDRWFRRLRPNLDVFLESSKVAFGIESKLTELLTKKPTKIQASYRRKNFPNCDDAWWALLEYARAWPDSHFDVAQIIKHYLALSDSQCDGQMRHLLYLYWEPINSSEFLEYEQHSQDVQKVMTLVKDSRTKFTAMSYSDLWKEWEGVPDLKDHVERLRQRYELVI